MVKEKYKRQKDKLTEAQYNVCFLKGTEPPRSGEYYDNFEEGVYKCVVCDQPLFTSQTKFKSRSGWPSFFAPVKDSIKTQRDLSHGMVRTEVLCSNCEAHLGHMFEGGPQPTGEYYCVNSLSLKFEPKK